MLIYGFSILAGVLTAISPCVLPVLPLIAGSAMKNNRLAPIALSLGMISSFVVIGVALASIGPAIGIGEEQIRVGAAVLMLLAGIILLVPKLNELVQSQLSIWSSGSSNLLARFTGESLFSSYFLGTLLGAVWSPCVGPVLGAVLGIAAQGEAISAATHMALYGIGAALPLLLIAYGARDLFQRNRVHLMRFSGAAKPVMGIFVVLIGLSVLSGIDKKLEAIMLTQAPSSFIDFVTRF